MDTITQQEKIESLLDTGQKENIQLAFSLLQGLTHLQSGIENLYRPLQKSLRVNKPFGEEAFLEMVDKLHGCFAISVSNSNLERIPKLIYLAKDLRKLVLTSNNLSEITLDFTKFEKLSHLYLAHNPLERIPQGVDTLKGLTYLDLYQTSIEVLPKEVLMRPIEIQHSLEGLTSLEKSDELYRASLCLYYKDRMNKEQKEKLESFKSRLITTREIRI